MSSMVNDTSDRGEPIVEGLGTLSNSTPAEGGAVDRDLRNDGGVVLRRLGHLSGAVPRPLHDTGGQPRWNTATPIVPQASNPIRIGWRRCAR